jgi:hypothetical protein
MNPCACGCGAMVQRRYKKGHNARRTMEQLVWPNVPDRPEGECWQWAGPMQSDGRYGLVRPHGRTIPAHRVVYELVIGPIPEGLHIDHLCNNPGCVNPAHLEPVTQGENNRRAAERQTHCINGHDYADPDNVRLIQRKRLDGSPGRRCRACDRALGRRKKPCPECGALVVTVARHIRSMHSASKPTLDGGA